ncbi:MAG: hypothetical protein FWC62_01605 [Firmicutes bacterium]|nr:hypothetical protein [Bacillota bacterium]
MAFGDIIKKLDKDGDGFELSDLKNIGDLGLGKVIKGDFLQKVTKFGSFKGLLTKVGVEKPEDLASVDKGTLDTAVKENSPFGSWQEMIDAAEKHS